MFSPPQNVSQPAHGKLLLLQKPFFFEQYIPSQSPIRSQKGISGPPNCFGEALSAFAASAYRTSFANLIVNFKHDARIIGQPSDYCDIKFTEVTKPATWSIQKGVLRRGLQLFRKAAQALLICSIDFAVIKPMISFAFIGHRQFFRFEHIPKILVGQFAVFTGDGPQRFDSCFRNNLIESSNSASNFSFRIFLQRCLCGKSPHPQITKRTKYHLGIGKVISSIPIISIFHWKNSRSRPFEASQPGKDEA